jgi:hypothetical protein
MTRILLVTVLVVAATASGSSQSANGSRTTFFTVHRPLTMTVSRDGSPLTAMTFQPSTLVTIAEDASQTPGNTVGYHGNIEIRALINPPDDPSAAGGALLKEPSVVIKVANADVTLTED